MEFQYKNLLVEKPEEGIIVVKMNRPEALNALNPETLRELGAMSKAVGAMDDIHVVIITGSGEKSFVAGADIKSMLNMSYNQSCEYDILGGEVGQQIEEMPQMVIAAVNGYALGGGTWLANCCNLRIASEKATFGAPEVKLGVFPCWAFTQILPRLIGTANALELLITGKFIDAYEAFRMGLVNKVVPHEELMDTALEWARQILANGPYAVRLTKRAVYEGLSMPLAAARTYERRLFGTCFLTEDQKEGMSAFLEKRKPAFIGK